MSTLFRFLTLLLCLELIVSPVAPNMSLIAQNAYAEDCPTGFTYDSILNRCLTKTETANVMNATMACGNDTQCYKENAQKAFQDKVNAGEVSENKKDGLITGAGKILAIAGPVTVATAAIATSKSSCLSGSFYAMVGGALAVFVGDTMANMQHKSRLKKIKKEWGKIVNPEEANGDKDKERSTSIEAQSQAFEMLAQAEESLAKAAKMKKTFFMIGSLAYAASTVMSVMEIISSNAPATAAVERPRNTCAPAGTGWINNNKKESLYSLYSSPSQLPVFNESQFHYNIAESKDLTAMIFNQKAMSETNRSPSIDEYESFVKSFVSPSMNDQDTFQGLKEITVAVLKNLNPVSNAFAVEQENLAGAEESGGGGSASATSASSSGQNSATSSSQGVNTNAAKAFKEDEGKGFDIMGLAAGLAVGVGAGMAFKSQMTTPEARAILSGVLAGWSMMMSMHAGKQAKIAEERAELLRKMKDEFASASGAIFNCKSEDRNDPGKPSCYCYTADNQRNSSRGNSQICQKLWAGLNKGTTPLAGANPSSRVCVNQNRQADATCACKQSNTCMKVSLSSVKGLGLGSMGVIGGALAPVNGVLSGAIDGATLGDADLTNKAAKINDLVKKMDGLKNKELKDFNKTKAKKTAALTAALNKAGAGMGGNSLGSAGGSGMPSNAGEAARMLEKEIADQVPTGVSGAQTIATGSEPVPEQPLEFGLTGDQLAAQEGQIAEVMKQDLDYGGNDINPGSKTNIFEVLSNRYQRSGMRRLFDEKGETKPDAAAKTDITQ